MIIDFLLILHCILSCIADLWQNHEVKNTPLTLANCYRYYGNPIQETIIHNKNMNMSLINEYYSLWGEPKKIHFNDTLLPNYTPNPVDSVLNRDVSVCSKDTFLLMMFLTKRDEYELRQVFRKAIPQGIVIQRKKINRVFVVAISDNERDEMKKIRREKEMYGDIVISRHQDSYAAVLLSTWDGYVWVREHCNSAVFTGKFDTDAIHFLGNYISLLLQYPTKRFYGGRLFEDTIKPRSASKAPLLRDAPFDYPSTTRVQFALGPATILSVDMIDYLVFGAMYEPFFVAASEDLMTGVILKRFGIKPVFMGTNKCPFLIWRNVDCSRMYMNVKRVPDCICCYHPVKGLQNYKIALQYFTKKLYTSQVTDRVDLSKPITHKSCIKLSSDQL